MIDDEGFTIAGIRGPLRLEDILFAARKSNRIAPLQVVRADRVVGIDHVRSAALHARRALDEGRAHADRAEVEFLRYLSGERQIQKALEKMGVQDGADAALVIGLGAKAGDAVRHFLHGLGLEDDDRVLQADLAHLQAFGIPDDAIQATTPERRLDLVLEAVAAVDLMRT